MEEHKKTSHDSAHSHQSQSFESVPPQKSGGSKAWMIIAIIAIIALIGLGIYGYTQMKKLNQEITSQKAEIASLNNKNQELETSLTSAEEAAKKSTTNTVTDDEQTLAAAKNTCEAQISPQTKKARIFRLGTTTGGKKVAYSTTKTFATINAGCTDTAGEEGSGAQYILKKVNGSWVVVDVGQQIDEEKVKLYGIPANLQ